MAAESEIEVSNKSYRIGRIDAWTQFHVLRRITPLLTALASAMRGAKSPLLAQVEAGGAVGDDAILTDADKDAFMSGVVAMADVLATMSDADCDYIMKACLKVCKMKDGEAWHPILSSSGHLMFDNVMVASDLLQLTAATLQRQEGLVDFFQKLTTSAAASVSPSKPKES